jgi:hypothetical protein
MSFWKIKKKEPTVVLNQQTVVDSRTRNVEKVSKSKSLGGDQPKQQQLSEEQLLSEIDDLKANISISK